MGVNVAKSAVYEYMMNMGGDYKEVDTNKM